MNHSPNGRIPLKRRPKVCQVLHGLNIGGAEVLASLLARKLSDQFDFVFACLDEEGPLAEELRGHGIDIHCLERKSGLDARCAWCLAQLIRREQVDVIHAHQYTPLFYSLLSGVFGKRPSVVFTEHGRHHPDFPRKKRMLFNHLFLRRHDRIVAVGEAVQRALVENEGISAKRIRIIYNGAVQTSNGSAPNRDAARAKMRVTSDDFVVILVARFDPVKDLSTALYAIEQLVRSVPNARLVLVGDGAERAAVEQHVRQRRLQPYVRLLGFRQDVDELLSAADVCLLTSLSEGIPLALIEAMAQRLPVVATAVGGVPEVVLDGATGCLVPASDPAAIEAALARLAQDAGLRASLGERGYQRASHLFSQQRMCDDYRQIYAELPTLR